MEMCFGSEKKAQLPAFFSLLFLLSFFLERFDLKRKRYLVGIYYKWIKKNTFFFMKILNVKIIIGLRANAQFSAIYTYFSHSGSIWKMIIKDFENRSQELAWSRSFAQNWNERKIKQNCLKYLCL